jgi:hypothetical protein
MGITRGAIEAFISDRITAISSVNARDIAAQFPRADRWLSALGISHIFTASIPPEHLPLAIQLLRKTEFALIAYSSMRSELLRLVGGPATWTPYYRAVTHGESAISALYQARYLAGKHFGLRLFEKDDGSPMQRLNSLYNAGKHQVAQVDEPMWLTNAGFECAAAKLSYLEFEEILSGTAALADTIANGGA